MITTTLRKVGGSVTLSVPPALLDLLHLSAGAQVELTVADGRLVIAPRARPHYTLAGLLAASDYAEAQAAEHREWVDAPAVGREPR